MIIFWLYYYSSSIANTLTASSRRIDKCATPAAGQRFSDKLPTTRPTRSRMPDKIKINALGVGWVGWYKACKFQSKVLVNVKQFRNSHHAYIGGCDIMSLLIFKLEEGETRHGQGSELKAFLRIKYPTPGTLWLVKRKLILYPYPYM